MHKYYLVVNGEVIQIEDLKEDLVAPVDFDYYACVYYIDHYHKPQLVYLHNNTSHDYQQLADEVTWVVDEY